MMLYHSSDLNWKLEVDQLKFGSVLPTNKSPGTSLMNL